MFTSLAHALLDFFSPSNEPDPIVRLFQVEYAKEYNLLVKSGIEVNKSLALEHMGQNNH